MSKTKLWSLQFSCRRLARETRSLGRTLDQNGGIARDIEQHLVHAAQLIQTTMEQLGSRPPQNVDLAQLAFGDNVWASNSPLADYRSQQESPPSPQHRQGLRVNGKFVATPDLVTFLCSLKKSGVLLVDTADERFTIELQEGDIVHAHSDGAPDGERLGDVLVEQGILQQADLDALLGEGLRSRLGDRLGTRILQRQLATEKQLLAALETQIRRLFARLFTTAAAELTFWEGPPVWGEQHMRLNATMLLLDGARAIDESQRPPAVDGLAVFDVADQAEHAEDTESAAAVDDTETAESVEPVEPDGEATAVAAADGEAVADAIEGAAPAEPVATPAAEPPAEPSAAADSEPAPAATEAPAAPADSPTVAHPLAPTPAAKAPPSPTPATTRAADPAWVTDGPAPESASTAAPACQPTDGAHTLSFAEAPELSSGGVTPGQGDAS